MYRSRSDNAQRADDFRIPQARQHMVVVDRLVVADRAVRTPVLDSDLAVVQHKEDTAEDKADTAQVENAWLSALAGWCLQGHKRPGLGHKEEEPTVHTRALSQIVAFYFCKTK